MPLAVIAGAGIGGLSAALALRRAGWDVRVFERAAEPRELGFGILLAPNAVAALRSLGIAEDVVSGGITPTAAEMRRPDGRRLRRLAIPVERMPGTRPTVVLRPVLHQALLNGLGREALTVNRGVEGFDAFGSGVTVRLVDGSSQAADMLIGADGVASVVRARLHPADAMPRPSGYVAIRGASPAVDRLGGLHAILYLGTGIESGLAQASPTTIYWYVSLLARDVRDGPADAAAVLRRCTAGFDQQFHAIVGATPPAAMRIDELLVRDPLDWWGDGRVTLLGDAAHPMLPHTGQGAAQALEDAVALGHAFGAHADPAAALRDYERLRLPRTRRVMRSGPLIARVTTTRNRLTMWLRDAAIRVMPEQTLIRAFTAGGAGRHAAGPRPA